ncbi:hypothetical protein [Streptomyces sp. Je 1-332]
MRVLTAAPGARSAAVVVHLMLMSVRTVGLAVIVRSSVGASTVL